VRPLLTGEQADLARDAIRDIAAALRDPAVYDADPELRDPSVGRGSAGLALFFHELARAGGDPADERTAFAFLDQALERAAEDSPTALLYSGTVGVGWTLAYMEGVTEDETEPDDVDELVFHALSGAPWPSADLIRGVAGTGVYFLERLPHPAARKGLELVVERLTEMSEVQAAGTTWFVDPATVLEDRRALYPEGYYDTGVAHGQGGMIAVLALMVAAGVESARPLLADATRWMLAQRLPGDEGGRYPLMVDKRPGEPRGGRLAWCYGDAGLACALLSAGQALGDRAVVDEAVSLALAAAGRDRHDAGASDAPLCHGSAGLMHIFNRLWQSTGEEALAESARRWFDLVMKQRRHGEPVAGFGSVRVRDAGEVEYEPLGGFLEGAAGVGLALLAATGDRAPDWDALLLTRPAESPA
jgi:lantibiotic modifying enzyme